MTVLKATFRTHDGGQPVEIKLSWHKQLTIFHPESGYTVTANGEIVYSGTMGHEPALRYAIRLYRKYERQSHERATAQSKTP